MPRLIDYAQCLHAIGQTFDQKSTTGKTGPMVTLKEQPNKHKTLTLKKQIFICLFA